MTSTRLALLLLVVACSSGEHRGGLNEKCGEGFACDKGLRCQDGDTCSDPALFEAATARSRACTDYFADAERLLSCRNLTEAQRALLREQLALDRKAIASMNPTASPAQLQRTCMEAVVKLQAAKLASGCM